MRVSDRPERDRVARAAGDGAPWLWQAVEARQEVLRPRLARVEPSVRGRGGLDGPGGAATRGVRQPGEVDDARRGPVLELRLADRVQLGAVELTRAPGEAVQRVLRGVDEEPVLVGPDQGLVAEAGAATVGGVGGVD